MSPSKRTLPPRGPKGQWRSTTYNMSPPDENIPPSDDHLSRTPSPASRSSSLDVEELLHTDTLTDETSDISLPSSLLSSPALHTAPLTPLGPSPLSLSHEAQEEPDEGVQGPAQPASPPVPPAQVHPQQVLMAVRQIAMIGDIETFRGRQTQNPWKFLRDLQ
jgi:hypothetical protein